MENKELGRCVYVPALARILLRNGHKVIDIKPNRENKDRTVFVFADESTFNSDLEKAIDEIKGKREKISEQVRLNTEIRTACL